MRYLVVGLFLLVACQDPDGDSVGRVSVLQSGGAVVAEDAGRAEGPRSSDANPVQTRMYADARSESDQHVDAQIPILDAHVEESLKACETAQGTLGEDYTVLEFHDGTSVGDISGQTWSIVGQAVSDATLHESVVFELDRPARILGYAVQFGTLPTDPNAPVTVSLHPDFGYNGFDFWQADALASVSHCREDLSTQAWVEFILPEPVSVPDPGLVHLVHRREKGGAAWLFDSSPPNDECTDDCCTPFGACHSAWNFPDLTYFFSGGQQNFAYNGLSLTFRYDYLVRLYIQYTDDVSEDETVFTRVADVDTSNRMAWADYDNDGDEDLLVNGPRLLRNEGERFVDVTEEAGLVDFSGSGVFGDFDNDGCLDVFLYTESYTQSDFLLRSNCEGGFVDVTEASGISDVQTYMTCGDENTVHSPTPAAAWVDVDADGFLDLYVANFICWSSGQSYIDTVWRSRGDGTFEDWTGLNGFAGHDDNDVFLATRGVLPADFDGDGDIDILANTYRLNRNLFYRNDEGAFTENGLTNGTSGRMTRWGGFNYYGHHIGAAVGDLDGDQDLDLVVAALAHPRFYNFSAKTEVLINQGDGQFQDIQGDWSYPAGDAGLRFQETHSIPSLGDFDNDGILDLVISAIYDGRPTDFYWGNGDGTFRLDAWRSGIDVRNGWGQALADFNGDGRLDIATSDGLYRNQKATMSRWLQTRVVGNMGSNRAGIGATVYVDAGENTYMRIIGGGTGQGCQDSLSPHFGLGENQTVERIRVRFVGSDTETVYPGPFETNQRIWLFEDGHVELGWVAAW